MTQGRANVFENSVDRPGRKVSSRKPVRIANRSFRFFVSFCVIHRLFYTYLICKMSAFHLVFVLYYLFFLSSRFFFFFFFFFRVGIRVESYLWQFHDYVCGDRKSERGKVDIIRRVAVLFPYYI